MPRDQIDVNYIGVELERYAARRRARGAPTLLYLGRLKRYKRIELLLDVLEECPEATLEIAGDGDHRDALEAEIARRGLGDRGAHARPRERGAEARALAARVGEPDRLVGRGLVPDGHGGGSLRHAQRGAGGGRAARVDRGRRDRPAGRRPGSSRRRTRLHRRGPRAARAPRARRARERAREFTWDRTAERTLALLEEERERRGATRPLARAPASPRTDTGRAAGLAAAVMATNVIALAFTVVFARLLGAPRLRLAGRAAVRLHHPDGPGLGAADRGRARA